jgi:hypothetical protein
LSKKDTFVWCIGATARNKILTACKPDGLEKKTYKEVIEMSKKLFSTTINMFSEIYKFYSRTQNEGESFADYAVVLQQLSAHCEFTDSDRAIRDRFIMGIRDTNIRKKLIESDKTAKLEAIVEKAKIAEALLKEAQSMSNGNFSNSAVSAVNSNPQNINKNFENYRGNVKNNNNQIKCYACDKFGHYAYECKNKNSNNSGVLEGAKNIKMERIIITIEKKIREKLNKLEKILVN